MAYWELVQPIWRHVDVGSPEDFLRTYEAAPPAPRTLLAAHWCASETSNGGLGQFFSNSTGVLAPEAAEAFEEIGMPKAAQVMRDAMAFFGPTYPRELELRKVALEKQRRTRRRGASNVFGLHTKDFDLLMESENGGFDEAADRFADANADPADAPPDRGYPAIALHYLAKVALYDGSRTYLQMSAQVPERARTVMVAHLFAREVAAGGMERFFGGCAGMVAQLAAGAFEDIDIPEAALIIRDAMRFFPGVFSYLQFDRAQDLDMHRRIAGAQGASPFRDADSRLRELFGVDDRLLADAANRFLAVSPARD